MRKVTYFLAGTVADFSIPDDRFDAFCRDMNLGTFHSEEGLGKARSGLEAFMLRGEKGIQAGPEEVLAACFVWNFFNTHPDNAMHIEGDVVIIDLNGDGGTIDYASARDIQLAQKN